ncbi:DgyrCDS1852 [Dimorphilus gyrociliatus]|uniref:DgyrCDS1852 n=1 Tax=Dimorphilus gyrociliatus TaxID=2664684 RepID=A0A7I8VBC8_9ANNE|nr:DgyrCDS1852 [Dimorphilus gyrociliatus]
MPSKDRITLSYGDSILRESDLTILNSKAWLNDRIIGFAFEYFQNDLFKSTNKIIFISPEVTQLVKLSDESEVNVFLEPLDLCNKEVILLAVNDQEDLTHEGGTHWSLLMYYQKSRQFFHIDSSPGFNVAAAKKLSKNLSQIIKCTNLNVEELPCIHQTNAYDCGIHVICNARVIGSQFLDLKEFDVSKINISEVENMRNELLNIISTLQNKL